MVIAELILKLYLLIADLPLVLMDVVLAQDIPRLAETQQLLSAYMHVQNGRWPKADMLPTKKLHVLQEPDRCNANGSTTNLSIDVGNTESRKTAHMSTQYT